MKATLAILVYALFLSPAIARAQSRVTPFQDPSTGETYHIEGGVRFWHPTPDLTVSSSQFDLVGTVINAGTDLGVTGRNLNELRLVLRPAKKHKFRLNYLPMSYLAQSTVHRTLVFNGNTYGVNLPVATELHWNTLMLGYEYDFVYQQRFFVGLVTQMKFTNVKVDLSAPGVANFTDAKAPIPNLGGIGRVYVMPNIAITGELVGIKIPNSLSADYRAHYVDFDLNGTVNVTNNVGAQVGYRSLDVGYMFKKDTGTFLMKGLYFGAVVRY